MDGVTKKIKKAVAELIDSGTHLDVAKATQIIAKKLGLNERLIKYTHIELRNKFHEFSFKSVPFSKRILFLPHCLKNSKECKAEYSDEGLQCKDCGKCQICELKKSAIETGYSKVFITPGGSMVHKLIEKYKPQAVLGVCCYEEAMLAFDKLQGTKIAPQAVLLLKDGCKDTSANIEEVREKLLICDVNAKQNSK